MINNKIVKISIVLIAIFQTACAIPTQVDSNFKREFTYDYSVPGKSKADLWKAARNFMATTYRDISKVIKVADEEAGTLVGMGIVGWNLSSVSSHTCNYNYSIKFAAKADKARMQFELLNPIGGCGWDRPSEDGYKQLEVQFNELGKSLGTQLSSETGKLFKDF